MLHVEMVFRPTTVNAHLDLTVSYAFHFHFLRKRVVLTARIIRCSNVRYLRRNLRNKMSKSYAFNIMQNIMGIV